MATKFAPLRMMPARAKTRVSPPRIAATGRIPQGGTRVTLTRGDELTTTPGPRPRVPSSSRSC